LGTLVSVEQAMRDGMLDDIYQTEQVAMVMAEVASEARRQR